MWFCASAGLRRTWILKKAARAHPEHLRNVQYALAVRRLGHRVVKLNLRSLFLHRASWVTHPIIELEDRSAGWAQSPLCGTTLGPHAPPCLRAAIFRISNIAVLRIVGQAILERSVAPTRKLYDVQSFLNSSKLLILWWAQQDSNLRLPPCEGGVKPDGRTF